jgi:hypothetical protein
MAKLWSRFPKIIVQAVLYKKLVSSLKKTSATRTITIVSEKQRQARAANLARLRDNKGKEIYRRRKAGGPKEKAGMGKGTGTRRFAARHGGGGC